MRIEVLSVLRRHAATGRITVNQASTALDDLLALPLQAYPTASLLRRAWELRDSVSAYDACYVSLAEALGCVLITADARLARAPNLTCAIELLEQSPM